MKKQLPIFDETETKETFLDENGTNDELRMLSREQWKAYGKELGRTWRECEKELSRRTKGQHKWEIGDWLISGEVHGRMQQKELQKVATRATGLSWGTLRNCMCYSRAFKLSRRRDNLSYDHHVKVAPFDEETQELLLNKASEGDPTKKRPEPWTGKELEKAIKRLQEHGTIPKTAKKPRAENTTGADADQKVVIQGKVSRNIYGCLTQLAAARGVKTPEILIWDMAIAYYKENKDKLQAEIDKYSAERKAAFFAATKRDAPMEEQVDAEYDEWHAKKEKSV